MPFVPAWMDIEDIVLSETRQMEAVSITPALRP